MVSVVGRRQTEPVLGGPIGETGPAAQGERAKTASTARLSLVASLPAPAAAAALAFGRVKGEGWG